MPQTLAARYQSVRDLTETLAAPLSDEDQTVQSMPDVSPTKWHRAHTTWFFETFLLLEHTPGYQAVDPSYGFLFNSYYEAVGARHPRPQRGLVTRPGVAAVADYRARVDEAMHALIASPFADEPAVADLIELGLHHEQQHQELLLMDIQHVLAANPHDPAYRAAESPAPGTAPTLTWTVHPGGIVGIGDAGSGFHFDNEGPRHEVLIHPHRLADRLVTNGEWLEFMADGGYEQAGLWLSDGWYRVQADGWDAPLYWSRHDGGWVTHSLTGVHPVDPAAPVGHVSFYEAEAFARWAGARLPTEFEWEAHAGAQPVEGNLLSSGALRPMPAGDPGPTQFFGDVWEWTRSAYAPYPGFRPAPGAVGEYNGKFMIDQQVLRGGSCLTPADHVRATYRNFFPAPARWMAGGVRLADDGAGAS
ncbi:MAG: ergothioneine biosynthesis protein EgtB [Acidimicrobiales bacterium]